MHELRDYPVPDGAATIGEAAEEEYAGIVVPLQLVTDAGVLAFFSTTTVFGTPVDITLSELAIESFFPADAHTAAALARLAGRKP
jgi:hypothetical protein